MPTSYPGGLDAFTNPTAADMLDSPPHDVQHADVNDAVEAIEAELGTDPAGTFPTVRERVEGVEAALSGLVLDDIADVAAATPVDGQVLTFDTVSALWRPETPSGGGGGGAAVPAWVTYLAEPVGTPHAADDEFDDGTLNPAWIVVQDPAGPFITVSEGLDVLSIMDPGGDVGDEVHAVVRAFAPAGDFTLETAVKLVAVRQNYILGSLVAADGATYGAGNQVHATFANNVNNQFFLSARRQTGFKTLVTDVGKQIFALTSVAYLRLSRVGDLWTALASADGVSWDPLGNLTFAATVSHVGFAVGTAGGAGPIRAAFEYFRVTEP